MVGFVHVHFSATCTYWASILRWVFTIVIGGFYHLTKFHFCTPSSFWDSQIHVYCLRVLIQCEKYVNTNFRYCVSDRGYYAHVCPYHNVCPYCCFTRTTLFTELLTYMWSEVWFLLLFIRITLFTTMCTVIIVVCSLKGTCLPSFVLIGCCVSELLYSCMSLS